MVTKSISSFLDTLFYDGISTFGKRISREKGPC